MAFLRVMKRIIVSENVEKRLTGKCSRLDSFRKNPPVPQLVYSSDINIVDVINTAYK